MALNINGTTGISGVDGSVSAPAVTGTDSNTGITFPSADTIKFSTGGVERMQISNSGVSGTGVSNGKILEVHHVSSTTHQDVTSSSYVDLTNLSITLTPAATSKCFVLLVVNGYFEHQNTFFGTNKIQILRDSTEIALGMRGIRLDNSMSINYLQTQSTISSAILDTHGKDGSTSVTYKARGLTNHGHMYVNTSYNTQSSITVYEVAPN